jgi:hypothetical protein
VKNYVVDPSGEVYYYWTGIISIVVLYNLMVVVARSTFQELQVRYRVFSM